MRRRLSEISEQLVEDHARKVAFAGAIQATRGTFDPDDPIAQCEPHVRAALAPILLECADLAGDRYVFTRALIRAYLAGTSRGRR